MEPFNQEDQFLKQLFQKQKEEEQAGAPSFDAVYEEANNKMQQMKKTKYLLLALLVGAIAVFGFAKAMNNEEKPSENIEVLRAETNFYKILMKEGKVTVYDIQFDYDKADLKPSSQPTLDRIARMMKKHRKLKLSIEGHTDSDGSTSYNQKLSEARAVAVKAALVSQGVDESRLVSKGFGETKPLHTNDTVEGKALNRRVVFVKM